MTPRRKRLPSLGQCAGCLGWGLRVQSPFCSPCHQWRSKRNHPEGQCRRCKRLWRINDEGFCRACVVAVTEYDAAWYFEPAQAAEQPTWTQLAFCLPASVRRPALPTGTYRLQTDGRYHAPGWARAQRPALVVDDKRICPQAVRGQVALFPAPYRLLERHAIAIRGRLQGDLTRLKPLVDEVQAEHRLGRSWRVSAMDAMALALAARDAAGQDLVDAVILDALPHQPAGVTRVLNKAGLLASDLDHAVAVLPHSQRPRSQPQPRSCDHCLSWGRNQVCDACRHWRRKYADQRGRCGRCGAGPLPLQNGRCRDCTRQRLQLGPDTDTGTWRQLRFAGPSLAGGSATRRDLLADRPGVSPPVVLTGQATIFEVERDWRPLAGALLPAPLPPVKALLADFARYTTENRWNQQVHEPMARVLRVAATWLGADTVFREDELRALHRVFGGKGRIRGLVAFLDQREQLVPSPPRRNRDEAFVQRTIAAFPPRISDELGTWVGVLRGVSRSHHRVTDYATMRRYLIYLATPLADWTTRYTTLRQVTEADITATVTAVKGPRAHERAVAVRSLFRALKHATVFLDPTRGLRITRQELLPTTLAPGRPAGLLETSSNPATRLVLALVALHATSGTDLRNLVLSDVLLTRRQLLIRRPHGRHVVHLDDTTADLLHAWLRYRHRRWPRTVNSHLLVTQQTVSATDPVCADYVYRRFDPAGLTLRAVRADRILDEARESEDPVHLVRVFGISITTAMKYIHAAHPHRAGPVPH
ncbi:hypothetical protein [Streptomyces himastatinicus]|uniref:hypothetical protein n=1 Tax=Streptomyces himastatinicus TaxID=998084 RepID=UPI0012B69878|nr:hypothetical protein [Streptomyces himastatinicus]